MCFSKNIDLEHKLQAVIMKVVYLLKVSFHKVILFYLNLKVYANSYWFSLLLYYDIGYLNTKLLPVM